MRLTQTAFKIFCTLILFWSGLLPANPCVVYIEAVAGLLYEPVVRWESAFYTGQVLTDPDASWDLFTEIIFDGTPQRQEVEAYLTSVGGAQTDFLRRKIENRTNLFRNGYRWRLEGNHAFMPAAGDILVVGCANGVECGHLALNAPTRRLHFTNIEDIAVGMTASEMDYVRTLDPGIPAPVSFLADASRHAFPERAYDGIVINDTFAFFPPQTRAAALETLGKSLRSGGTLLIQDAEMVYSYDHFVAMQQAIEEMIENQAPITDFELALLAANHGGVMANVIGESGQDYYGVRSGQVVARLEATDLFREIKIERYGSEFRLTAIRR